VSAIINILHKESQKPLGEIGPILTHATHVLSVRVNASDTVKTPLLSHLLWMIPEIAVLQLCFKAIAFYFADKNIAFN